MVKFAWVGGFEQHGGCVAWMSCPVLSLIRTSCSKVCVCEFLLSSCILPLLILTMCTPSSGREIHVGSRKRGEAWLGSFDTVDAARLRDRKSSRHSILLSGFRIRRPSCAVLRQTCTVLIVRPVLSVFLSCPCVCAVNTFLGLSACSQVRASL